MEKKVQENLEVESGSWRIGGDSELQEDESKDHWGFNYGVTGELQKKWTSVDMEVITESCALQRSARILALLLANYILLPVLPNKTKLYLFMYKVESTTFVLSSSCRHFIFRMI